MERLWSVLNRKKPTTTTTSTSSIMNIIRGCVPYLHASLVAASVLSVAVVVMKRYSAWRRRGAVYSIAMEEEEEEEEEEESGDAVRTRANTKEETDAVRDTRRWSACTRRMNEQWNAIYARAEQLKRNVVVAVVPQREDWELNLQDEFVELSRVLRGAMVFVEVLATRHEAYRAAHIKSNEMRNDAMSDETVYSAMRRALGDAATVAGFFIASVMQDGDEAVEAERTRRGYASPRAAYPSSLNNTTTELRNEDLFAAMATTRNAVQASKLDHIVWRAAADASVSSFSASDSAAHACGVLKPTLIVLLHDEKRIKIETITTHDAAGRDRIARLVLSEEEYERVQYLRTQQREEEEEKRRRMQHQQRTRRRRQRQRQIRT